MNIQWDGHLTAKIFFDIDGDFDSLNWREWNARQPENCLLILTTKNRVSWAKCKMEAGG